MYECIHTHTHIYIYIYQIYTYIYDYICVYWTFDSIKLRYHVGSVSVARALSFQRCASPAWVAGCLAFKMRRSKPGAVDCFKGRFRGKASDFMGKTMEKPWKNL